MRPKPMIKGPVKARRNARIVTHVGTSLSRETEEILLSLADVMSEGGTREHRDGSATYFGSTMISIAFDALSEHWRGPLDPITRAELVKLIEGSVRLRLRLMRLARAQATERLGGRLLGTARSDAHVRMSTDAILVDVDFEAPVEVSLRAKTS